MSRRFGSIPGQGTTLSVRSARGRRRDRVRRRDSISRLSQIGRVHAPEADMRPVLPHRDLLLKAVAPVPARTDRYPRKAPNSEDRDTPGRFMAHLVALASQHAEHGDLRSFSQVVRNAFSPPFGVNADVCVRAVTIAAVQRLAAVDSAGMEVVMNCLAEEGVLEFLRTEDIGIVLDVLVRGMLARGDLVSAFRGELLSRVLETRLRRGTYTALIGKSDRLELGLSIFHRALAIGVVPNRKMFNTLLDLCFNSGDGTRARAVLAEMATRDIRINSDTVSILLTQAPCVDSVAAVLQLVKAERSQIRPSPHLAELFVHGFLRIPTDIRDLQTAGDARVARAFDTIDWFFKRGVGVSHGALDMLILHCCRHGKVEAALRAWREMRRGWLGAPSRRARASLWAMLKDRPVLRERLVGSNVGIAEMKLIRRNALRQVDDKDADHCALHGDDMRDQATVLHRWCRQGRVEDAMRWVDELVKERKGRGVDVRLVLAVLSCKEGSYRAKVLDFCLTHLASGESVCGERVNVIRRVEDDIWRWILQRSSEDVEDNEDGSPIFDERMNRAELRSCLERVIRVTPP